MKKYKLIKEYPGSPKLGTIITPTNGYGITYLDAHKYPEFWQEIVEKDYEILSLISDSPSKTIITYENGGGCYQADIFERIYKSKDKWLHAFVEINANIWKIHSVKRLSDGEVFTIGDKVDSTISDLGRSTDLTGFKLDNSKISLGLKIGLRGLGYYPLNTIIKCKEPLFTTEDGIDVYVGDKISTVSLSTMELYTVDGLVGSHTSPAEGFKYFSSKEAAEEYILMNKPKYSLNDIIISIPKNKDNLKVVKQIIENLKNM